MDLGAILIGTALLIGILPFLTAPFRAPARRKSAANPSAAPAGDRRAVLEAINELDFDFQTGKVPEDDYTALRAALMAEAAALTPAADAAADPPAQDDPLEAMIRARREALTGGRRCRSCSHTLQDEDQFCPSCGASALSGCPSCGASTLPEARFCSRCGASLESASSSESTT